MEHIIYFHKQIGRIWVIMFKLKACMQGICSLNNKYIHNHKNAKWEHVCAGAGRATNEPTQPVSHRKKHFYGK